MARVSRIAAMRAALGDPDLGYAFDVGTASVEALKDR